MNSDSQAVIRFLDALQTYRSQLSELRNVAIHSGAVNAVVNLNLSGNPFKVLEADGSTRLFLGSIALNLHVLPTVGQPTDFGVDILWDAQQWYVRTDIWIDDVQLNQRLLKTFPERNASTLDDCLNAVQDAIRDLRSSREFADLLSEQ